VNNVGKVGSSVKCKLYGCKIYDNGTLIRNYMPVKNSNGEIGLLDKVNNVFYKSASTTPFLAGPAASYTQVEYIESTGTQYIDTGFKPNNNTKVIMEAQSMGL
jgi:hypothetical protein